MQSVWHWENQFEVFGVEQYEVNREITIRTEKRSIEHGMFEWIDLLPKPLYQYQ
jgi:hypothetical protein